MKRVRYLFCVIIFIPLVVFAQNEAGIWYFGDHCGLDFSTSPPQALLDGAMFSEEGCATACNVDGELLFYTNGETIWNREHQTTPNGTNIRGSHNSSTSAVVVQKPGTTNLFYIFTTTDFDLPDADSLLCYTLFDMTLDGGLGDVDTSEKNVILLSGSTERIIATKHANGVDTWVVGLSKYQMEQKKNGDKIPDYLYFEITFLVSEEGIARPYYIPLSYQYGISGSNGISKLAPDGFFLIESKDYGITYSSFNNETGQSFTNVNHTLSIPPMYDNLPYGVEYSLNSDFGYVGMSSGTGILQFDLRGGIVPMGAGIQPYQFIWEGDGSHSLGALQMGPDGKIYIAMVGEPYLSVIHFPNEFGYDCGFELNAIDLNGRTCRQGLPYFVNSLFYVTGFGFSSPCLGQDVNFTISDTSEIISVSWDFGDPQSGTLNSSTLWDPTHVYENFGSYDVSLTVTTINDVNTFVKTLEILPSPSVDIGDHYDICQGESVTLDAGPGYFLYTWQNGLHQQTYTPSWTGTFSVEVTDYNGCKAYDEATVTKHNNPTFSLGPDQTICQGDSVIIDAGDFANYLWQDSSTNRTFTATQSGNYSCTVQDEYGCEGSDQILVTVFDSPGLFLGNDTSACEGNVITLDAGAGWISYLWQDGTTNQTLDVTASGTYYVTTSTGNCQMSDTITVTFSTRPAKNRIRFK